jgi:hypothetical protein
MNSTIAYKSPESVANFKHLGMTVTNRSNVLDEIKSKSNSGSAWYHEVQYLLSKYRQLSIIRWQINHFVD